MSAPLVAGAAITCGIFSAPVVRTNGMCFMAVGLVAIFAPQEWGTALLAVAFGGLHIGFGIHIARHHGG